MTEDQHNNNSRSKQGDIKSSMPIKDEEEKKKKLLVEEKQPDEQLPVGEGHETEVIEENKD